jgi:hypothetical protein
MNMFKANFKYVAELLIEIKVFAHSKSTEKFMKYHIYKKKPDADFELEKKKMALMNFDFCAGSLLMVFLILEI